MGAADSSDNVPDLQLSVETGLLLSLDEHPLRTEFFEHVAANDRGTLVHALATLCTRRIPIVAQVHMDLARLASASVTLHLRERGGTVFVQIADVVPSDDDVALLASPAAALRRLQRRSTGTPAGSSDLLWEWNIASDTWYFSPALPAATRPIDRIDGSGFSALIHPDDVGGERDARDRHLAGAGPYETEFRLRTQDGYRWFRVAGEAWYGDDGTALYVSGIATDVDAVRRREDEIGVGPQAIERLTREVRDLSTRLIGAQESERRHIARELHDQTGQTLTAAVLELEFWRGKGVPVEEVDRILDIVKQALGEVRNISLQLRPPLLDEQGLDVALRAYLERQGAAGKFDVSLSTEGLARRLSPALEITAFRLVQEAVTNILRHAGARHVEVLVRAGASEVMVRVSDNGSGCVASDALTSANGGFSLGLISMKERAALVGGRCEFISSPAVGSIVLARLPLA
ncbi:MAG TPA: histidine kinase [Rudaea sp.]